MEEKAGFHPPLALSSRIVLTLCRAVPVGDALHDHELSRHSDQSMNPLLLVLLAFLSVVQSLPVRASSPTDRPNIVFILADDLGYADVGCYGAKHIRTPNIDRIASEGVRFTNFYVAQPVCTASRAALLSGCYSNRVGMSGALNHTSSTGIHPREKLISTLLKEQGYATAAYGKWHLGHHPMFWPTHRGFDEFFGLPYSNDNGPLHPVTPGMPALPLYEGDDVVELNPDQSLFTKRITDRAVRFIETHSKEPFFLYVPHIMPHVPIFASQEWRGKSQSGVYGDVVEELDASVGEILSTLKRMNLDQKTIVVFTSDNGPFLSYGEHAGSAVPFREGKLTTFEGGVRMPCVVRWPGHIPSGAVSDAMIAAMDFYPTFAKLCGAPLPKAKIDGIDLSSMLLGESNATGRDVFWYYSGDELQAVRQGVWKLHLPHEYLTVAAEPGKGGKPSNWGNLQPKSIQESGIQGIASRHGYRVESLPLSLFNLQTDPGETQNRAAEYPEVVKQLQAIAASARNDLGDGHSTAPAPGIRPPGDVRPVLPKGAKLLSNLEYTTTSTGALLLDLYLPRDLSGGDVPVLLWIHGGGWSKGSKENCPLLWLVEEGIAVASINYRLVHESRWPAQIEDCRSAVAWLRTHAKDHGLNPNRIAVSGGSAGGHLAALLGTLKADASQRVCAVIDLYGPTDLLTMPANTPGPDKTDKLLASSNGAKLLGGMVKDLPELAREASALSQVSSHASPFLIIHGDMDKMVPLEQSTRMHQALLSAGVESTMLTLSGAGHGGKEFDAPAVREAIRGFLQKHSR